MTCVLIFIAVFIGKQCGHLVGEQAAKTNPQSGKPPLTKSGYYGGLDENEMRSALKQIVTKVNQRLPMDADNETIIERVSSGPGIKMTYHYKTKSLRVAEFNRAEFASLMRGKLFTNMKYSNEMKYFRDHKIAVDFDYVDVNYAYITTISVTPADY